VTRLSLTICLALAWFFAVNALLSLVVAAGTGWYRRHTARRPGGAASGRFALASRLLPAGLASAVAGVVVPAFLAYEPSGGLEPVGWMLRVAAVGTVVLLAAASGRGALLVRRAGALVRRWEVSATPVDVPDLAGTRIRAYAVDDRFPVVALVGVWRPRLFIARQVLAALTASELKVAIAHELAHRRAWDNGKRALFAWAPDLLGWLAAGRRLERQWAAAAEREADCTAAGASPRRGVDLAGALVKVSRLAAVPATAPAIPLFSTFHECGDIGDRVRRLVSASSQERPRRVGPPPWAAAVTLVVLASLPQTWQTLHAISELCVQLLP
jgi:Zn-dependent protease with chaperone function